MVFPFLLFLNINEDGGVALGEESQEGFVRFIDDVELADIPVPDNWNGYGLRLHQYKEDGDFDDVCDLRLAVSKSKGLKYSDLPLFRNKPLWIQGNATPVNPDGVSMEFIGQVNTAYFSSELPEYELYLFYCPKYKILKQYAQMS